MFHGRFSKNKQSKYHINIFCPFISPNDLDETNLIQFIVLAFPQTFLSTHMWVRERDAESELC